jgi:hypothetical protein
MWPWIIPNVYHTHFLGGNKQDQLQVQIVENAHTPL